MNSDKTDGSVQTVSPVFIKWVYTNSSAGRTELQIIKNISCDLSTGKPAALSTAGIAGIVTVVIIIILLASASYLLLLKRRYVNRKCIW